MPLSDGDHIRGLLGTYCRLIDAADFAGVGQLMADAVLMTDDGTAVATGADEVASLYRGIVTVHEDGTPGTQHVVVNTTLEEIDGGAIRGAFGVRRLPGGLRTAASASGDRLVRRHVRD